jgi:aryl carrier-like protein
VKLKDIYRHCVEQGIAADPRGEQEVQRVLADARTAYDGLPEDEREFFDTERFTNPYADTRVCVGEWDLDVQGLITGIDMQVGEVLLADRLREKGERIDLILAHHPEGPGFANLDLVMYMQADLWHAQGVRVGLADALIAPRAEEIRRKLSPINHYQAIDAARLLGIASMSCHTPADNSVMRYVQSYLDEREPRTLADVVKTLRTIPEYADAARKGYGPEIFQGAESRRAGRVLVDMTGGTEGPVDALNRLCDAGIDTIVGMHFSEDHRKRADELKLSLVVAGHMSSDALGMNLILDGIEREGVSIVCTSGMVRVSRA